MAVSVPAAHLSAGRNVCAPTAEAFSDQDRGAVARFADVAAVALTNMDALRGAQELADNLRRALDFRSVIEQAEGILMERNRVDADEAFRLLAQASQAANRKLRHVAEDLVLTGHLGR